MRLGWMIGAALALALSVGSSSATKAVSLESKSAPNTPTEMVVSRPKTVWGPAFYRRVDGATKVGRVYSDLLGLPPFPKGPMSCPAAAGDSYRLTFLRGGRVVMRAVASADGCQGVTVAHGRARWSAGPKGTAFWDSMASAVGVNVHTLLSRSRAVHIFKPPGSA